MPREVFLANELSAIGKAVNTVLRDARPPGRSDEDVARAALRLASEQATIDIDRLVSLLRSELSRAQRSEEFRARYAAPEETSELQKITSAALRGDANALYELGICHVLGFHGLTPDTKMARQFFKRAGRKGHRGARRTLEVFAPRTPLGRWLYVRGLWPFN